MGSSIDFEANVLDVRGSDVNPLRDPLNEPFAPLGAVTAERARMIEALAVALRNVRDKEGRHVSLRLPWVALNEMAIAAENPAAYMADVDLVAVLRHIGARPPKMKVPPNG